ncbi:hypothetical protein DFH28DRAFT_856324, partial [Melampsora americana]
LILGSTRTIMSFLQYERVRSFIALLGVKLPAYKTVQKVRRRLKNQFNFNVTESLSPLEKPCFGLQIKDILKQATELANPYVSDYLEFMPSLPNSSSKIFCFSQSQKWREGLDPYLRVQMINLDHGHFYLHEPVQLTSKHIVVPAFFYKSGNDLFAKCVFTRQKYECTGSSGKIRIEFQHVSTFDSELFLTINVNTFWREFNKIEVREG